MPSGSGEIARDPPDTRARLLTLGLHACLMNACKHAAVPKDCCNRFNFQRKIGAGEEIRTLDPNLGKVVLYH